MKKGIFIGCLILFCLPNQAFAQNIDVALTPQRVLIRTKPNTDIRTPLTIKNNSTESLALYAQLWPFTASRKEDGTVFYSQQPDKKTTAFLNHNVKLFDHDNQIQELSLAPNQQKEIVLVVTVSKNEKESEYTFSVVFLAQNTNFSAFPRPTSGITSVTEVTPGIATHVILAIEEGKQAENVTIEEYKTNTFFLRGPVPFSLTVRNNGMHHTQTHGYIIVYNLFGQAIGKIDIPKQIILANTTRHLESILKETDRKRISSRYIDIYKPLVWWDETVLLGPYISELTLFYGQKKTPFIRTIHFFAIPLIAAIIGVTLLLVFLFLKGRVIRHLR